MARARLTGLATLFARGVVILLGLVTLPLTSHYLGKERFGHWLILSSFIGWFAVADLGLSNGLINALSAADGKEDKQDAQRSIASAFWLLISVAIAFILLSLMIAPSIPWASILNLVSSQALAEISLAVIVVAIFIRALKSDARFMRLDGPSVACFRLHPEQFSNRKREEIETEGKQLFDHPEMAVSFSDRLVLAQWRLKNFPNYLIRILRESLLSERLRAPRSLESYLHQ